jgi:hypothetical protein
MMSNSNKRKKITMAAMLKDSFLKCSDRAGGEHYQERSHEQNRDNSEPAEWRKRVALFHFMLRV